MREKLAQHKPHRRDQYAGRNTVAQRLAHPVVLLGAEVVTHDRLHALGNTHHNHHKEHERAVHDTVGTDGQVAARTLQRVVDCEATVASAAPRMPQPSEKMKIGANITLHPTVSSDESMALRG